jgi:hypothetical protein
MDQPLKCQCGNDLKPTNLRYKSDVGSEDVYILQDMYCDNPKCDNYCGDPVSKVVYTRKSTP